jgi:zinc protease
LKIESERFREVVLRLFHTELEAVYEEFNIGQANDDRKVYKAIMELLFPNHTYGTQTTIGTGEHLKNPSMTRIYEYFKTYYVPNNMVIMLQNQFPHSK